MYVCMYITKRLCRVCLLLVSALSTALTWPFLPDRQAMPLHQSGEPEDIYLHMHRELFASPFVLPVEPRLQLVELGRPAYIGQAVEGAATVTRVSKQ